MSDPVTTVTTSISAAPLPGPTTLGGTLDAELAVVKARLAVLEASVKTDWAKAKAWLGTNWPHFVSWVSTGALVLDKIGVFKL